MISEISAFNELGNEQYQFKRIANQVDQKSNYCMRHCLKMEVRAIAETG